MARSEEIVDNPDGWVAEHIREYVATDGRRGHRLRAAARSKTEPAAPPRLTPRRGGKLPRRPADSSGDQRARRRLPVPGAGAR